MAKNNMEDEIILSSNEDKVSEINTNEANVQDTVVVNKKEDNSFIEVYELRERNKKVLRNNNGTEKAVYYPGTVHNYDFDNLAFAVIDNTFVEEDRKHVISGNNHFKARFNNEERSDELFTVEKDGHVLAVYAKNAEKKRFGKRKSKAKIVEGDKAKDEHISRRDKLIFENSLNGADLEYTISGRGVKENIIINDKASEYKYSFIIKHENLREEYDSQSVSVLYRDTATDEVIFRIPAPFMKDAIGGTSLDVLYELVAKDENETILNVIASKDWIEADTRVFPIVIDPQIEVESADISTYSWNNGRVSVSDYPTVAHGIECSEYTLLSINMPDISRNPKIKKAELKIYQKYGSSQNTSARFGLFHVTGDIELGSGVALPQCDENMLDYADMAFGPAEYVFNITELVDRMNRSGENSFNLMIKLLETNHWYDSAMLYGVGTENEPVIEITYEKNYAVGTAQKIHTHSIGRFGTANVDVCNGNLMIVAEDYSWAGNRMPVTIKHLFNSTLAGCRYTENPEIELTVPDYSTMSIGRGWHLNLMQSMVSVSGEDKYIFVDENGAETEFVCERDECGCATNIFVDSENTDCIYNATTRTMDRGGERLFFDELGRLIRIADEKSNSIDILYDGGQLTMVTDGADRAFEFEYDGEMLVYITAPDGSSIGYDYDDSGEFLTAIIYSDGRKTVINYADDGINVNKVSLLDENGAFVHGTEYEYSSLGRVTKVTEKGINETIGTTAEYDYSISSGRTLVNTAHAGDSEAITSVYTFDSDGAFLSEYTYFASEGDDDKTNVHTTDSEGIRYNVNNLLKNTAFTTSWTLDSNPWKPMTENGETFTVSTANNESTAKHAVKECVLTSGDSNALGNGLYQETVELEAGEYTFSAYVRISEKIVVSSDNARAGVYLCVTDSNGKLLGTSEVVDNAVDSIRIVLPFELIDAGRVSVQMLMNGSGTAYICAPQLEDSPYANAFNYIENGGFENDLHGWWGTTGFVAVSSDSFGMKKSVAIQGDVSYDRYLGRYVDIKHARDIRETFTLSGWAKGVGLNNSSENKYYTPTFRLRAIMTYEDTYCSTEEFVAEFSPATDEWQYASVEIAKSKHEPIRDLVIYCEYNYNQGIAYFDDIKLVRTSIELGLGGDSFTDDVTYDESTNISTSNSESSPAFVELEDEFGNVITETSFTDGEFGTLYRSFNYENDGNDLACETDARGGKTQYNVDASRSRADEITDRLGNKTEYEYDGAGRTAKVTNKNAYGVELADVEYKYNAFDNLTEIARGDGMKYVLGYNAFHNLESIGVSNKEDKLITYSYKNNNGRLSEMTYANGCKMCAVYNAFGQMVGEKWYDASNNVTSYYKYVYDSDGNIIRSIDIFAKKEYNYIYEAGVLIRATECDVTFDDEVITNRKSVSIVNYSYNTENQLIKKTVIINGEEFVYYYEHSEDGNTTVKFDTVTSHSKTDSFGRKVFDELQLGAGFVSRRFDYVTGQVTEEHLEGKKLKSSPTTQLVSSIMLSDGRTIQYEYDAEERITKVIDSIDGTTEYTYDALGQLITERCNGHIVNSMTYDTYGNILSKNGSVYTYGDTDWRDLLTAVDGRDIVYDKQGNPTEYLGHNLTWEKGRQLKSYDNNTYTYNANGIRTSKTVNGVTHTYTLDGTKILRETWDGNNLIPLYDNEECVCGIKYNGTSYFFLKNLQGDIISITDDKGESVAQYSYDAWGVCTILSDTTGIIARINPYRYRGYYYDEEIAKYYLQSRYYDAQVGRFVNGDKAYLLLNAITPSEHNIFTYCDNAPTVCYDDLGEAKKRLVKTNNSSIFTISDFYKESQVVKSRFELQYLIYGMNILSFSNYDTFKSHWNSMTTQNIVVVNCHASPTTMQKISIAEIRKLRYKNMQALILLGCNAGHYDYRYENVAFEFSKKISGCVLASDGTVYSSVGTPFVSMADKSWKNYRNTKKSKRITNKGWILYNRQKASCTYLYSITIISAIKYLKARNLFRFQNLRNYITI